jgi:hypothetical protein
MCCQMARLRRTADIQRATQTDCNQSEAVVRHPALNDRLNPPPKAEVAPLHKAVVRETPGRAQSIEARLSSIRRARSAQTLQRRSLKDWGAQRPGLVQTRPRSAMDTVQLPATTT